MKTLAFYLPQFHTIPENDLWWGEGYTEWTAVKAAKPLFDGHYQPRVPLNENYYNLLDDSSFEFQERLMHKYGVDGFCFYHYYFGNGRRLLDKPAENLLRRKDINIEFCFSWANESWARSWSGLSEKNIWNRNTEGTNNTPDDDGVLVKQEYGDETEWKQHFDYLLPFFKDQRYIKLDNKPIFIIHKADSIYCLPQMLRLWNDLAKSNSFDGIYIIGSNAYINGLDAYIRQEPNYSAVNSFKKDYAWLSNSIVKNALSADDNTFLCGCPSYDDTPRRGKEGCVFAESTPELFQAQMEQLYKIAEKRKQEFIFVNAWNEWGEGMYLEPDTEFGERYLEALKKAQLGIEQAEEMSLSENSFGKNEKNNGNNGKVLELKSLYKLMKIHNIEAGLRKLFDPQKEIRVAIYGFGDMGKLLIDLLKRAGISISYGLDQRPEKVHESFPVYSPQDDFPNADYLIVSLPVYYKEIFDRHNRNDINIISVDYLSELLIEIEKGTGYESAD